ncbi:ATP-binding protein [Streptomyces sp. NPDC050504]|uniref:ATP-binding protein n=1 Tax=Streptomyces sp. NPDC050504 TaxID=3365618 RepID=UPI003788893E
MPLSRQRRFPRARRSVPEARSFAREVLTEWGVARGLDDICLCVSELVTNAVRHGAPPGREFALTLVGEGELIRVEVRDSGGGTPRVTHAGPEDCTGRGLQLVTALANDFGVTEHAIGKTVWASFKGTAPGEGSRSNGRS